MSKGLDLSTGFSHIVSFIGVVNARTVWDVTAKGKVEEAEARAKEFECRMAFGAREERAVDLASLFFALHFASFLSCSSSYVRALGRLWQAGPCRAKPLPRLS